MIIIPSTWRSANINPPSVKITDERRGDHRAARLQIKQERLRETQDWSEAELVEHFERWARHPRVRE